jgi:hypothetical protein
MADVFERSPVLVGARYAITALATHQLRIYVGADDGSLRVLGCDEG